MIEKKFFCDICREESDIEKYTKYTSQLHGIKNKAILGGDVISYDVCDECDRKIRETIFELSRNGRDITK